MDALSILDRLQEAGISVSVDGDDLVLNPGSKVPSDLLENIRLNKPQIMDALRQSKPAVVSAPSAWHANEVARRVIEEGTCLFWSDLFGETIAFVLDDSYRDQVPYGVVVYRLPEIKLLFPGGASATRPSTLRLIHEAKKEADARVIEVARNDHEVLEGETLEF